MEIPEVKGIREALERLGELDPDVLGDGDTVVELHQLQARLDAALTRATGAFARGSEWAEVGAKGAVPWLMTRSHLSGRLARRHVRLGRVLEQLPATKAAFVDGEITTDHVWLLASARNARTAEALERDEAMLVDQARQLTFSDWLRALRYWKLHADPDGSEDAAERRAASRGFTLSESFEGTYFGKLTLDPLGGSTVASEIERLERQLYEQEWAETEARLGRTPTAADLPRTPRQRRADALAEMAIRSRSTPPGAQRPAPLFNVLVGYEELSGRILELANRQPITPGCLLPWLEAADIERAVFTPGNRIEVSERARFFTGATRRAIVLRDRRCTHPYCDVEAEHCQVDHIIPYAQGGPTTQANGRLHCGYHNRLRNHTERPKSYPPRT